MRELVWLLYRYIAAGFTPIEWLPSTRSLSYSDSLRAGTEIGYHVFCMSRNKIPVPWTIEKRD